MHWIFQILLSFHSLDVVSIGCKYGESTRCLAESAALMTQWIAAATGLGASSILNANPYDSRLRPGLFQKLILCFIHFLGFHEFFIK